MHMSKSKKKAIKRKLNTEDLGRAVNHSKVVIILALKNVFGYLNVIEKKLENTFRKQIF